MRIKSGHIVKFAEVLSNPVHGPWSTYEKEVRFPEGLTPEIAELMESKTAGSFFTIPVTHFKDTVYDPALVLKIPKKNLKGTSGIKVGMVFKAKNTETLYAGIVKEIADNYVLLDCNHPATCQKNVSVSIRIIAVREQNDAEKALPFEPVTRIV